MRKPTPPIKESHTGADARRTKSRRSVRFGSKLLRAQSPVGGWGARERIAHHHLGPGFHQCLGFSYPSLAASSKHHVGIYVENVVMAGIGEARKILVERSSIPVLRLDELPSKELLTDLPHNMR